MSELSFGTGWSRIAERLREIKVLPVTSFDDADQAEATAEALMRGGLDCIEVTFRTPAAREAIRRVAQIDGLFVAAGTVLSIPDLKEALSSGAELALAPGTNLEVIRAASELGMPFVPGTATPSEIEQLRYLGVRTVKVFPCGTVGGTEFLRSVASVYPEMQYIPTGGITASTASAYASAPGVLAVGGSWIAPLALVRAGRFDEIEDNARQARALVA